MEGFVILVAAVIVIAAAGMADRDVMHVLPSGSLGDEVVAFGLDGTDRGLPDIETLDEFLGEFLQGGLGGRHILGLVHGDRQSFGDIAALDEDGTGTLFAFIGIGGDGHDDLIGRIAGSGFDMDPGIGRLGGPGLLGGELGLDGVAQVFEVHFLGLELDIRHFHAVEIGSEGDVLHRVIDILGDVVVQQVLVEAGGDEPHTHGAHEAVYAVLDQALIGIGAENHVVADVAEGRLAGEEPGRVTDDQIR